MAGNIKNPRFTDFANRGFLWYDAEITPVGA